MFTYIKNLFNRPKRERGASRIQEKMLEHAVLSDHQFYIPFLHTPWLHYFNLAAKPVARLVEDGYLVQDRHIGWYSITDKGLGYLKQMIDNQEGNAHVTFPHKDEVDWTRLYNLIQASLNIHDYEHAVKVGP